MAGALVLVVGPSGAGKDTLIAAARVHFAGDPRFVFPRRLVTRDAVAELEDHDTVSRAEFRARREAGDFALSWDAHGLSYAVPKSTEDDMAAGRTVIVNVSRQVISEAAARYPDCRVLLVTADPTIRAERLARRGRETAGEIAARLEREGVEAPAGVEPIVIDNSGALDKSIAAFVAAVRSPGGPGPRPSTGSG